MTLSREEIVQQALALPPSDRVYVAEALDRSLSAEQFATPELTTEWLAEIEHRAAAYDRGELPADEWRTVVARLRGRYKSTSIME
ncbi:MAG: addiction module protein [Pirellulales bacterium]|nr:addiction module protein [Pirellulales bacterium]